MRWGHAAPCGQRGRDGPGDGLASPDKALPGQPGPGGAAGPREEGAETPAPAAFALAPRSSGLAGPSPAAGAGSQFLFVPTAWKSPDFPWGDGRSHGFGKRRLQGQSGSPRGTELPQRWGPLALPEGLDRAGGQRRDPAGTIRGGRAPRTSSWLGRASPAPRAGLRGCGPGRRRGQRGLRPAGTELLGAIPPGCGAARPPPQLRTQARAPAELTQPQPPDGR